MKQLQNFIEKSRGAKRLYDISSLPITDIGSEIRYFGSISKIGDNADWDWECTKTKMANGF